MSLFSRVSELCHTLAASGWDDVLRPHGNLDLRAADLKAELARKVPVDRNQPGFQDFVAANAAALEPGDPARSLLYHALASPAVKVGTGRYPTLEELDLLENYLYSLKQANLSNFPNAVVAVFAYHYRPGRRTPHGLHADIVFSRTGVSRVGTAPMHYVGEQRGFWPEPAGGGDEIAVLPARYAAFLAESRRLGPGLHAFERNNGSDQGVQFLVPVHKLFPGDECLQGLSLTLDWKEFHRNEKLRRVHTSAPPGQSIPQLTAGFDVTRPPFVRDSVHDPMVALQASGAGCLVRPLHSPQLVRPAVQTTTGVDKLVSFMVPPLEGDNRFWSSFQASMTPRIAPEYLNIRHEVVHGEIRHLDDNPDFVNDQEFEAKLDAGGWLAAHFVDDTCDGAVEVVVSGLSRKSLPAYSLVTAPDFFPLVDQLDIQRWSRQLPPSLGQFNQGSPQPLSGDRQSANRLLPRPSAPADRAFDADTTLTAVLAEPAGNGRLPDPGGYHQVSQLPDAASGFFAPGWDVSLVRAENNTFLGSFGLGSPFPEDAKLCAALNSFWPAVAPDASTTLGRQQMTTSIPMLDVELGRHPSHVRGGTKPGWDGEFGPFLEAHEGKRWVNHASLLRSDYVRSAHQGLMRLSVFLTVDSEELIRRMNALQACIRHLPPPNDGVTAINAPYLVSVERVSDWAQEADRQEDTLTGSGYRMHFAKVDSARQSVGDRRRVRALVLEEYRCQLSETRLCATTRGAGGELRSARDIGPLTPFTSPPLINV